MLPGNFSSCNGNLLPPCTVTITPSILLQYPKAKYKILLRLCLLCTLKSKTGFQFFLLATVFPSSKRTVTNSSRSRVKNPLIFFFLLSSNTMTSKRLEALLNNLTLAETSNRGSSPKLERDLGQIALESNILKAKLNNDQGLSATA